MPCGCLFSVGEVKSFRASTRSPLGGPPLRLVELLHEHRDATTRCHQSSLHRTGNIQNPKRTNYERPYGEDRAGHNKGNRFQDVGSKGALNECRTARIARQVQGWADVIGGASCRLDAPACGIATSIAENRITSRRGGPVFIGEMNQGY